MNRRLVLATGLGCAALVASGIIFAATAPTVADRLARTIRVEPSAMGSIEDALHIRKASGTVEFNAKVGRARLVIDLYRDGARLNRNDIGIAIDQGERKADAANFVVQVIDLDYLLLGDAKPGHCRVLLTLKLGNMTAGGSSDIAKDVFEGGKSFGFQQFQPEAATETEAPLFYMVLGIRPNKDGRQSQHGGVGIAEIIAANPTSDILVARLVCEDESKP